MQESKVIIWAEQQPFQLFAPHLTDQRAFTVTHPKTVTVGKFELLPCRTTPDWQLELTTVSADCFDSSVRLRR